MADNVQWIKLKVGMFDGNSFKKIKRAKIGGVSYRDKLTAIWFELLDLAGKSNANGYLVDSNEIPYHSFEDIAVMLDREEKEIELCMQFFINEKMVEIIDDIYCLTNFMQYQNQDGLAKIREQKRIAQAKWRERKKLGLVGVDTTVDTTSNLLSISNSSSNSNSISPSNSLSDYLVSKKVSNKKEKIQSYDEIFDEFGIKGFYRETVIEFIKQLKVSFGIVMLNDRLENLLIKLDFKYGNDDKAKTEEVRRAINNGYKRLECEGD